MTTTPITWVPNPRARSISQSEAVATNFPDGVFAQTRAFHRQIPGYKPSPLRSLSGLASMIGVGGIWVKDESVRLDLNSFKVLGGSFAIYRFIKQQLGLEDEELSFEELVSDETRARLGEITFATATDGNHGRGVAWAAEKLRCKAVIYVHKDTSVARIRAIESYGAEVHIVDGTYDDAVHLASQEADANGWQVISDTSWEGYEDIPRWVMQGYTTMLTEAQEQLAGTGIVKPTHVFVQAGVGALAAAVTGFYASRFGADRPTQVVVEPATADCLYQSAKAGDGLPHDVGGDLHTIMAGLACGEPSPIAWGVLWDCVDVFAASPDYVAAKGMRMYGVPLAGDPFIVSGESGAVTLGALTFIAEDPAYADLKEYLGLGPDSQILLINSEGNTDPDYFRRVVWEGADSVPDEFRKVLAGISQNG
ncbi:MAG: diaminopropionate ammonia-lyase [Acidimicrobiia bacterium]|nr:diaminopropionate ammonia-lyase [Acidimicrobiia bacterium]MBT8191874.1 diaminopropionate ammonia-lyase [Acidimicrobiia bacterium]RZV47409.1 MAG: diaminopropionate ammonia-lyase [Acidimicrobiia bacterium]